jgi:hypothetical protein
MAMRSLLALLVAILLSACATLDHGPRSLTLSREEIERGIQTDLGSLIELFRGLDARRPEVALLPVSGRLELVWNVALPGEAGSPFGSNYGMAVVLSGKPVVNPARNGLDLAEVTLDDVRVLGVPRVLGFGIARLLDRKGAVLPDLPLMSFAPQQLRVADVAYAPTATAVTWRGLKVDLEPR